MEPFFDNQVRRLYADAVKLINDFLRDHRQTGQARVPVPPEFAAEFFRLVDKVNLGLLEDRDNFFGYFLFQMGREIRFDISSPTAVNFKGSTYVLHFNPVIFLTLTRQQMETTIKHEILHVCSLHLLRARDVGAGYSPVAINMAMDIVVNAHLDYLPPYATTLEWVNANYSLRLLPFEPFEHYLEHIQTAIDLLTEKSDDPPDEPPPDESVATDYRADTTHDLWQESSAVDEQTLRELTEKISVAAQKGSIPHYLAGMVAALKNSQAELPWNLYLQKLMGAVVSRRKKTITRRNRRQPERLDLRGELRSHKAKILVGLDISGSISDEEFYQAVKEVLDIVKNYQHEIMIVECDSEIRRTYRVNSAKDLKDRLQIRGATRFSPVFEYANSQKINLLVYFTDGKGEDKLLTTPKGYKTLWVISGRGDRLSLTEPYGAVKKLNRVEGKETLLDSNDVEKGGYSMNNHEKMHV